MKSTDLLLDAFGRIREEVADTVEGLSEEQLTFSAGSGANTIAWLVWHLTRVQDNHVAEVAGEQEVWLADGWVKRFGLSLDPADTGYGHSAEQVAAVRMWRGYTLHGTGGAGHRAPTGCGRVPVVGCLADALA